MNLLSLLMGSMTNDSSLNALSGKTGLSSKSLSKLLAVALPVLLKFLTKNAGKADGAQSLLTALGGHKDNRTMAQQIEAADAADGAKILSHIFGNDQENVLNALAKESDLDRSQVSSALANMAPALMSGLSAATTSAAKVDLSDGLDLSDLMAMFGGQAQPQQQSAGLLGSLLGGGQQQQSGGLLGSLLGGGQPQQQSGGLLGGLLGGGQQQQSGGLLGGLLGGGQQQQSASGLDGLLGLLGGSAQQPVQQSSFDGGDLLGMLSALMK